MNYCMAKKDIQLSAPLLTPINSLHHGQERFTTISATLDPCRRFYKQLHGQEKFIAISATLDPCQQFYELLHGQEKFPAISATFDTRQQFNELRMVKRDSQLSAPLWTPIDS
jgi:hypothetical protein